MRVLIIDWFNLIKRYTYNYKLEKMEPGEIIDKLTFNILNRICDCIYQSQPDLIYICSDNGFNKRAASVIEGYKANRKRVKSLTEEEREKDYFEYLKSLISTLPILFVEVKDTEADMIIMCLIKFLKRLDSEVKIVIASSDSDMIQLLDENTKILDWYKGDITIKNWYTKHSKHNKYFNVKNYALGKSIVGDVSDNIKGIDGWGWKKVSKLFSLLDYYYKKELVIDNVNILINLIYELLNNLENIDKKDRKFFEICLEMLKENKKSINNNMAIIDLSMLENPFLYQINSLLERITFNEKIVFNKADFLKHLRLDRYGNNDLEYFQILSKNSKASVVFYYIAKKSQKVINILQLKKK